MRGGVLFNLAGLAASVFGEFRCPLFRFLNEFLASLFGSSQAVCDATTCLFTVRRSKQQGRTRAYECPQSDERDVLERGVPTAGQAHQTQNIVSIHVRDRLDGATSGDSGPQRQPELLVIDHVTTTLSY